MAPSSHRRGVSINRCTKCPMSRARPPVTTAHSDPGAPLYGGCDAGAGWAFPALRCEEAMKGLRNGASSIGGCNSSAAASLSPGFMIPEVKRMHIAGVLLCPWICLIAADPALPSQIGDVSTSRHTSTVMVPFVGCKSDGQLGPVEAPA